MEEVHNASHRTWIDDDVVNVRQFLDDYMIALTNGINNSAFEEDEDSDFEREYGLGTMKCEYQETVEPATSITIPNGVNLSTIRHHANDLEKRAKDSKYSCSYYNAMKFCKYPPHKNLVTDLSILEDKPVDTPDVVMSVQIFTPEMRLDPKVSLRYTKMPSFHVDQEFLVLGSQFLTELRDKIDCVSDKAIPGECSDCPSSLSTTTCKDIYKSGFFYIGGVFYNDMRDKDCRDYSETIIKWSKNGNRGIGPFKKNVLEKTKFIDLTIQLGYPYVYVHQGECEHLLVFTDLRLFSHHDVNNRYAYPLYVQVRPSKRIFCMVCHSFTSMWVVFDNKRLPENPFFFCKSCFTNFNYDIDNQKVGEFRAYYFPDRTKLS